jgi:DNA repair photolyase
MPPNTRGDVRTPQARKGRGALSNVESRFDAWTRVREPLDAEHQDLHHPEGTGAAPAGEDDVLPPAPTVVTPVPVRVIISRNRSPDIPFDQSVNPYQGCEHGCVYCYARPTHAYLGLSPGLDFERRIFAKTDAAARLRAELSRPGYQPGLIALGANTDPYQPAERKLRITRDVVAVLAQARLPFCIVTKSALVTRDIDLLARPAAQGRTRVFISLSTLDATLARELEPRAPSPERRLQAMRQLAQAGVPVGVFCSPLIPALNDRHLEQVLKAARQAGASSASYVMLRLPLEVRDLFVQWLQAHVPERAEHVMSLVRQMRDGRDNAWEFGQRMKGNGPYADLLNQRFHLAARRLGLATRLPPMSTAGFRAPPRAAEAEPAGQSAQLRLF